VGANDIRFLKKDTKNRLPQYIAKTTINVIKIYDEKNHQS